MDDPNNARKDPENGQKRQDAGSDEASDARSDLVIEDTEEREERRERSQREQLSAMGADLREKVAEIARMMQVLREQRR